MKDRPPRYGVLGTAREEFDIATGYWRKWQRCEDEKAELLEAAKRALDVINPRLDRIEYYALEAAIQKAEAT